MKFFWKIYFSFTVLFLLSFGAFGTWMIQLTFEKSWQRLQQEAERENRMFQLSFEMNLNALDEVYRNDGIIPVTAASIIQNLSDAGSAFLIYNGDQELLYENQHYGSFNDLLRSSLDDETPCGYQIQMEGDRTYLLSACRSMVGNKIYYLENIRDISAIYEEREQYYDWYSMIMLILAAVITVLVFGITHMLTRSISELSQTTRRFTKGDYEVRASEAGGDEIAELAQDFNDMADTISEKMEELVLQAKKQEDFTASFAHELKTPLTSIIGYADMLRTMECSQEEMLEAVNYIFHQGKRLESLSFKLLELIVSDKQTYAFRPLSVQALMGEALRLTKIKRAEKHLELSADYPDFLICGEKDLLISVFTNFLDNAGKAVEEGGCIRIRGRQYKDRYLLCIMDNGCGMEQKELARITEAFYMVDKSRARKEGGAGLGMTLCSRILTIHEVRWKIFSILHKGTVIAMQFRGEGGRNVMLIKNHRLLLCLTGTILLTAGVIFLPRHLSRSLDRRNLNQVEVSAREHFSFLEQGANDVCSAVRAFRYLNQDSSNPVLLASIEEPIQINSDLINEVYIQAMSASEYEMLPWLRYLYTDTSAAAAYDGESDLEVDTWLNWSDYVRSARYYSLTCASEENPKKQELLNFWYLHFSDMRTFDYYFVVNAVNYQIYYAEIHNDTTAAMIAEEEEYKKIYTWNDTDDFYSYYGETFAGGCMLYYQSEGYDVINQNNLYQKLNLAILYFEDQEPVYVERSVSEREGTVMCQGICIGFQDVIRWVRQLPEA